MSLLLTLLVACGGRLPGEGVSPDNGSTIDPALQDTEWILTHLQGQSPHAGSQITLNFDQEGFDGFASCNRYGGGYEAAAEGTLIMGEIWQTVEECKTPDLRDREQAYVETLGNVLAYRLEDAQLELKDATGETILTFTRKEELAMEPAKLLGTAWQLDSADGKGPIEGSSLTLAFHNESRVGGHAGCSGYVASYEASGDDLGFLFLAMLGSACFEQEALLRQQDEFTTLLSNTTDYRLMGDELELVTQDGQVLAFRQLPDEASAGLEETPWALSAFIEDKDVEGMGGPVPMPVDPSPGTEITATFEGGVVSGSSGCNHYRAAYALDGATFSLQAIAATEMACLEPSGVMEQEQRYLSTLRDVTAYRLHDNQLWLETEDGRAVVYAHPVSDREE
jgi:heat shock protein HslJ